MIYEIRTYTLKTRSLAEVEKRFGEAYEYRKKYSPLTAFWHTEIGPLNEIIHIWGYKDLAERARIRGEASKDPNWPPKIQEFIRTMSSEIIDRAAQRDHPHLGVQGPRGARAHPGRGLQGSELATEDPGVHPHHELGDHRSGRSTRSSTSGGTRTSRSARASGARPPRIRTGHRRSRSSSAP